MRIIRKKNLLKELKKFIISRNFRSLIVTIILVISVPVTILLVFQEQDIRQKAASNKTGTISISPPSGTFPIGQQFSVNLVIDGGGQPFNTSQANISVSSNLSVQSLTIMPPESGGCNFTFVNQKKTPTVSDPSFAGGILNGFSAKCTLYTMLLTGTTTGPATVNVTQASIKGYDNHGEILLSVQNGSYTVGLVSTPIPTPTLVIPTLTPTATPTSAPTPTPIPTSVLLPSPVFDSEPSDTYSNSFFITGTKSTSITEVWVNNSNTAVTYPSETTWQYSALLTVGDNTFTVYGKDSAGNVSGTNSITINLHKLGDINGDNIIDLTDLSIFGVDWEKVPPFDNSLSDMNSDLIVDLTDFSILAKAYGN